MGIEALRNELFPNWNEEEDQHLRWRMASDIWLVANDIGISLDEIREYQRDLEIREAEEAQIATG